jgi:hypothetical protein
LSDEISLDLGTPEASPVPGTPDDDRSSSLAAMEARAQQETTAPVDSPSTGCQKPWLELTLLDPEDKPLAGAPYKVELPDVQKEGKLDDKGFVHIDGVKAEMDAITVKVLRDDSDPEKPVYNVHVVPKESEPSEEREEAMDPELDIPEAPWEPY